MHKFIIAALAITALAACDILETDNTSLPEPFVLYDEGLASSLTVVLLNSGETASGETVSTNFTWADDDPEHYEGQKSLKLDWSTILGHMVGVDGYLQDGVKLMGDGTEDRTPFNALTFYAKAAKIANTDPNINKFGIGHKSDMEFYISSSSISEDGWQKFIIPLFDASKLNKNEDLFYAFNGMGPKIYIDNLKYEVVENLKLERIEYTEPIEVNVEGEMLIPNAEKTEDGELKDITPLKATFTLPDKDDIEVYGKIENHLSWSTGDSSVATVDRNNDDVLRVKGVKAGRTELMASVPGSAPVKVTDIIVHQL